MTKDDIMRMAREAGMPSIEITTSRPVVYPVPEALERFAKAAYAAGAKAEREECAALCSEVAAGKDAEAIEEAIRARGEK